jgi:hypothetical protein
MVALAKQKTAKIRAYEAGTSSNQNPAWIWQRPVATPCIYLLAHKFGHGGVSLAICLDSQPPIALMQGECHNLRETFNLLLGMAREPVPWLEF